MCERNPLSAPSTAWCDRHGERPCIVANCGRGPEVRSGTIRATGRCPGAPSPRHRTRRPVRWPGRLSSAGGDLPTGSRGPAETPERSPSGSAQLVRRGQAAGGPAPMSLMRTYRRALGLSQSAFAARLNVPLETYRPWDAGRREPPPQLLTRARTLAGYPDETVLLPLPVLALMIGVHVRTLHAAARSGRLVVAYDTRTTFRRLRPRATLKHALDFRRHYYGTQRRPPATPVPLTWASVPEDYDVQLKALRRHLDISQAGFARLVGAAGKAVVYQWEARKRTPSPLFWQRVHELQSGVHPHPVP